MPLEELLALPPEHSTFLFSGFLELLSQFEANSSQGCVRTFVIKQYQFKQLSFSWTWKYVAYSLDEVVES